VTDTSLECTVEGVDAATADELISDLQEFVADKLAGATFERVRDSATQDLGLTLLIVLGPSGIAAVAKVLSDWLQSRAEARLKLSRKDSKGRAREVEVHGQVSKDQRGIIEDFLKDD